MKSVTIVGAGAVGRSIALALFYSNIEIRGIYSEQGVSAQSLAKKVRCGNFGTIEKCKGPSDIVIIAVPDKQIRAVAEILAEQFQSVRNRTIVHTSGALNSDELLLLKKKGAATASFHPLQTFSRSKRETTLKNIWCAVEGDRRAVTQVKALGKIIGLNIFTIKKKDKPLYHASAVFASNYLVTLLSVVESISRLIHIPKKDVWKIYSPLIRQTIQNVIDTSPSQALTGPILRGDTETVSKHIQVLTNPKLEQIAELYSVLGLETIRLVKRKNAR